MTILTAEEPANIPQLIISLGDKSQPKLEATFLKVPTAPQPKWMATTKKELQFRLLI